MRSMEGKSVLVTGGAGFIGSHLVDELIANGASKVVVVDNFFLGKKRNLEFARASENLRVYNQDASDPIAMQSIVENEGVEVVFNLATKALGHSFADPEDAYMVNVEIARTLCSLLRRKQFETLVHCSSSEAYGTALYVPIDEDHPLRPLTLYAAGKAAADLMVQSYLHMFDVDAVIVRPFNNFGPRQNEGTYAAIIPLTIRRILRGEAPVIFGDGAQTRDFLYVKDTVRALLAAYEVERARGMTINVATGREIDIRSVVNAVCGCLDYSGETEFGPERPADVRRHLASIERARDVLAFEPKVDLVQGICDTVEWYLANPASSEDRPEGLRAWIRDT